jgi:myo-inositol-1(or 4)-monophosphatase
LPGPDLTLLLDAAQKAGEVALRFWKKDPQVWDKPGEGPVTEADLAVNRLLEDRLRPARPGYGWLSEETPDDGSHGAPGRSFVIDPIDGTRAFVAGETAFAQALAVVEDGKALAAVVHLPAMGRTYAAEASGAATLDGAPLAPSARSDLDGARALASAATLVPAEWPGGVPALRRSFRASLAWRLCLVAEGRFDATLTLRDAWVWDVAAGALIVERAGARITGRDGQPLDLGQRRLPGLIAAPPALHAALLRRRHPGLAAADPAE